MTNRTWRVVVGPFVSDLMAGGTIAVTDSRAVTVEANPSVQQGVDRDAAGRTMVSLLAGSCLSAATQDPTSTPIGLPRGQPVSKSALEGSRL